MITGSFGTPSAGAISAASVKANGGVNAAVFRATAAGGSFTCTLPSIIGFLTYIQAIPVTSLTTPGAMVLTDVNTGAKYQFTISAGSSRVGLENCAEALGHCGVYSGPVTCEITGMTGSEAVDIKMFGQAS